MDIGLDWRDLDKPVNWKTVFGNKNPVDCEIGFGNGQFLIKKAQMHPERNFFGIDYSNESFRRARKKIKKAGVSNVKLVCLEAKAAFIVIIPDKSLSHIYLNFPDPWPKKKHYKNRLLDREFLTIAASCSTEEGKIIVATDDPFYRDFILEEIAAIHLWHPLFQKGWTDELSDHFTTKYEKKWRKEGKEIFYMMFQKKAEPELDFRMKECKIPRKITFSPQISSRLKEITGETIREEHSISKLLKYNKKKDNISLNIFLKDDTLIRKINLNMKKKSNNEWELIIPSKFFRPLSLKKFVDRLKALDK